MSSNYSITGSLGQGEETPLFHATLWSCGVPVARIDSHGQGGCARVLWLTDKDYGAEWHRTVRLAAEAWLASEAARLWRSYGLGEPSRYLAAPTEAAILVVPAHLRGEEAP